MGYKGNYTAEERREFVQKRKEELFDSMTLHVEELIREIQRGNPEKLKAMLDFFSTKASGSGLGLPIVHAIVTQHGGAIGVESSPLGGTRFWFTLPAAR